MPGVPLVSRLPLVESFDATYLTYHRIFPLGVEEGRLRVAAASEPAPEVLDDLVVSYGCEVELVPVDDETLESAVRRTFAAAESVAALVETLDDDASPVPDGEGVDADARDLIDQPPVIRFVNLLIREAYEAGASDIHLEATAGGMVARFRMDGVLARAPSPPPPIRRAVISRIKLLAELDISVTRVPQDGRFRLKLEERDLDLRVSTVPTLFGESVVLRLLDRGDRPVTLDALGMDRTTLDRFRALVGQRSHGVILATGPTGSGKTTTLYAALGLRDPEREKVITIEDPVEYQLPGVAQVPVNRQAGVTFAAALRSLLRQDLDVLMIGEMRDAETAGIAIQASMTGHLVFSTMHTNDAASALVRLVDLHVEPYMIAASVEGVLAQRLVRRTCAECAQPYEPDAAAVGLLASVRPTDMTFRHGIGCPACHHTGYRGRTGVFELLQVTDRVRDLVTRSLDLPAIREQARVDGTAALAEAGWAKVRAGVTTVEEVLRVVEI